MTAAATRQDVQSALERAKNSIIAGMFSRNDAQNVVSQLRNAIAQDLRDLHSENQSGIRLAQTQHDQILQRIGSMERNLITIQQMMLKIIEQQSKTSVAFQRNYTDQPFSVQRI